MVDDIANYGVDALGVASAECVGYGCGKVSGGDDACAESVGEVVVEIGNGVGDSHNLRFEREVVFERRYKIAARLGMPENALPDFVRKVKPAPLSFYTLHDVKALPVVSEAAGQNLVQLVFTDMPKRCVSKVMPKPYRLGEVFIEIERARDGARNLADFESVGKAGNIVVAQWRNEDLRLMLQPAERLAVEDAVSVALVFSAYIGWRLGDGASGGLAGLRRKRGQASLARFESQTDAGAPFRFMRNTVILRDAAL